MLLPRAGVPPGLLPCLLSMSATTPPSPSLLLADYLTEQRIEGTIVRSPASMPTETAAEAAVALGVSDVSRVVKSLVFVAGNGTPLLVVVGGTSRVDTKALERAMGYRVRLATPAEAEVATGCVVGCIPPLCVDACSTLRYFIDDAVLADAQPVYAGAGEPSVHLRIDPACLCQATGATVGKYVATTAPPDPPMAAAAADAAAAAADSPPLPLPVLPVDNLLRPSTNADELGTDQRAGGPNAPPLREEVKKVLAAKALSPLPIELPRAEVLRVRRQARQLLFASLRLLQPPRAIPEEGDSDAPLPDSPSSPLLSTEASWQIIVGKTLHSELGDDDARELLKGIRPGALISASGRAQLNPRLTGPDLVVRSLSILEPPPAAQNDLPREAKPPPPPQQQQPQPELTRRPLTAYASSELPPPLVMVDDAAGISMLSDEIDALMAAGGMVGIDAEWRPRGLMTSNGTDPESPLALLQLATSSTAYVVDMLAIGRDALSAAALQSTVQRLMRCATVDKVGFAMSDDLWRMEAALPGATDDAEGVYDLQRGATRALGMPKRQVVGLLAACETLLGVSLDKSEQRSDWGFRPLSDAQLQYAAADASVLLPLAQAMGREAWTGIQLGRPRVNKESRANTGARPRTIRQPRPPSQPAPPPPPRVSTGALPLAGVDSLSSLIGTPLGGRGKVLRLCAGESAEMAAAVSAEPGVEVNSAGGSGLSLWADGGVCLYINTANVRPGAGRYRNHFWREPSGELAGSVCFSWHLGRGQRFTDRATRAMLNPETPCLLFCRRQPSKPYRFCGRLTAAALAQPEVTDEDETAADAGVAADLSVWTTTPPVATHIIWRLVDGEELLTSSDSLVEQLFGAAGIGMARPAQYVAE